jgi:hypothetical protein
VLSDFTTDLVVAYVTDFKLTPGYENHPNHTPRLQPVSLATIDQNARTLKGFSTKPMSIKRPLAAGSQYLPSWYACHPEVQDSDAHAVRWRLPMINPPLAGMLSRRASWVSGELQHSGRGGCLAPSGSLLFE